MSFDLVIYYIVALRHLLLIGSRELIDELVGYLKEAIDRKEGNFKRRRKKDVLRVQLAHIFELMAANKTFAQA